MTLPNFFVEENKILSALFDEGLELLHLRKPDTEAIYSERLLTLLPKEYRNKIVVHDHFHLKSEYGLKGIHLNHRNPLPPKGYSGQISCTCHTLEEIKLHHKSFNYLFYSPTFPTTTSNNEIGKTVSEQLREASKKGIIDKKVIAFGGVTLKNISIAKDLNFGGVVILRDFWNRFDIHSTTSFKELCYYFRQLRKATD